MAQTPVAFVLAARLRSRGRSEHLGEQPAQGFSSGVYAIRTASCLG